MSIVRVGVGVLARHPDTGHLLLGRRTVNHGQGCYSFPGGHLQYGEEFVACAARELREETGLTLQTSKHNETKVVATLNNIFHETQKHYVTILY